MDAFKSHVHTPSRHDPRLRGPAVKFLFGIYFDKNELSQNNKWHSRVRESMSPQTVRESAHFLVGIP